MAADPLDASSPTSLHGRGLSPAEVAVRLQADGYNELPHAGSRTPLRILRDVLREPMLALLLGGGVVYLLIGDLGEALILLAFATLSILITAVQETRTERVLEALRDLTSPRALVVRDGVRVRIPGREVVRDDLIVLAEGDRVPSDAVLLECEDLHTDESLLTGEPVPVRKVAHPGPTSAGAHRTRAGGDDLPYVFAGTLVVRGAALCMATATGPRSEIGRIGVTLSKLQTEAPRLQTQTRRLVRNFAFISGAVTLLVVVLYGVLRGDWLEAMLAGIALGMSMLPEEFPVILTVFMAMGAWRISQARVLTRRAAAIEALGSATVLCTDKTGTLTENRMKLVELRLLDGTRFRTESPASAQLSPRLGSLLRTGVLASARDPTDPMEKAFHDLARERLDEDDELFVRQRDLVRSYPLRPNLLAMTNVWRPGARDGEEIVATKGAPEAVARLCGLDPTDQAQVQLAVDEMARDGLRVLGVARAARADGQLPDTQDGFGLTFLGLAGLADPLRESVPMAVADCRSAGIRVVMVTGDYPATASAIAGRAGLEGTDILTGRDLDEMNDAELAARAESATVFARIMPEQKLRIVEALKANGEVVAMTGDGVNDAPSLKAAHIGIAMGGRGTDVAREASSIVLLDDDFGSIVKAIRLGRRIYDNLRKSMGFIFAVHVPIAGLALLPLLLGLPPLFGPVHIAFLEMVIDPVCSIVFEAETEEADIMRRPPRPPAEPLFSRLLIGWGLLQGLTALVLVGAMFVMAYQRGMPQDEIRAIVFVSLVAGIAGLVFVNRSFDTSIVLALARPNPTLGLVLAVVAGLLSLTLAWQPARDLFRFGPLHADDLAIVLAGSLGMVVILELLKSIALGTRGRV